MDTMVRALHTKSHYHAQAQVGDDPLLTSMDFRGEMPIRSTNASKLPVVRRCIIDFADRFLGELATQDENLPANPNARTYRVLLGQPGIGKTMSLNYLVSVYLMHSVPW